MNLDPLPHPSMSTVDEDLREILDEAERRKEADLQRKSRKLSWILGIPMVVVLAWAAGILVQHRSDGSATPAPLPRSQAADPAGLADFDQFRPEALRVGKSGKPPVVASKEFKIVDQEDIRFAMQLLNYLQPPSANDGK